MPDTSIGTSYTLKSIAVDSPLGATPKAAGNSSRSSSKLRARRPPADAPLVAAGEPARADAAPALALAGRSVAAGAWPARAACADATRVKNKGKGGSGQDRSRGEMAGAAPERDKDPSGRNSTSATAWHTNTLARQTKDSAQAGGVSDVPQQEPTRRALRSSARSGWAHRSHPPSGQGAAPLDASFHAGDLPNLPHAGTFDRTRHTAREPRCPSARTARSGASARSCALLQQHVASNHPNSCMSCRNHHSHKAKSFHWLP